MDFMRILTDFPDVFGVVLAGGASSRMGHDKARIRVAGEPLILRQLRLLSAAGVLRRAVAVSQSPPTGQLDEIPPDVGILRDEQPNQGPLAGIERALSAIQPAETHVLVLAVDLPRLTPDFIQSLILQVRPGIGVVPSLVGRLEPLVAVYPVEAFAEVVARLGRGEGSVQNCLRAGLKEGWMIDHPVMPDEAVLLTNWNRPEDMTS